MFEDVNKEQEINTFIAKLEIEVLENIKKDLINKLNNKELFLIKVKNNYVLKKSLSNKNNQIENYEDVISRMPSQMVIDLAKIMYKETASEDYNSVSILDVKNKHTYSQKEQALPKLKMLIEDLCEIYNHVKSLDFGSRLNLNGIATIVAVENPLDINLLVNFLKHTKNSPCLKFLKKIIKTNPYLAEDTYNVFEQIKDIYNYKDYNFIMEVLNDVDSNKYKELKEKIVKKSISDLDKGERIEFFGKQKYVTAISMMKTELEKLIKMDYQEVKTIMWNNSHPNCKISFSESNIGKNTKINIDFELDIKTYKSLTRFANSENEELEIISVTLLKTLTEYAKNQWMKMCDMEGTSEHAFDIAKRAVEERMLKKQLVDKEESRSVKNKI